MAVTQTQYKQCHKDTADKVDQRTNGHSIAALSSNIYVFAYFLCTGDRGESSLSEGLVSSFPSSQIWASIIEKMYKQSSRSPRKYI